MNVLRLSVIILLDALLILFVAIAVSQAVRLIMGLLLVEGFFNLVLVLVAGLVVGGLTIQVICTMKTLILSAHYKNYIIQDKIITGKVDDKWKGGARYWSVLRPTFDGKPRNSYLKITKEIQKLEGCN